MLWYVCWVVVVDEPTVHELYGGVWGTMDVVYNG